MYILTNISIRTYINTLLLQVLKMTVFHIEKTSLLFTIWGKASVPSLLHHSVKHAIHKTLSRPIGAGGMSTVLTDWLSPGERHASMYYYLQIIYLALDEGLLGPRLCQVATRLLAVRDYLFNRLYTPQLPSASGGPLHPHSWGRVMPWW
jgi:hypothetical protein